MTQPGAVPPIIIAATDATGPASKSASTNLKNVGDAGAAASQQLAQSGAAFIESLQRQADQIGKTRAQIAELRAQQLGVAEAAAPLVARLRATEQTVGKLGVSTAQTAAAMRMLPAQFTDIATQLAGGQNPFLILLQQGGQIKDSFGGIGPAIRALGTYITPFAVLVSAAAAAVAALAVAYYQGSKEGEAFNRAVILSGGYAGKSTSQLIDMAAAIDGARGNGALAADALAQLAGSGRIAGDQLRITAEAAVAFSRATGDSIDEVVKDYVRLAEEPTKASAKLNEQYHYLTASIYEQIAALEEAGKKNEAAALAENTFAIAMKDRAASVAGSLGVLQKAWNALAADAREAWNAMLDIGREQSTTQKIASLQKTLDAKLAQGPLNDGTRGAYDKGVQALRDQLSLLQSTNIEERKFASQRAEYVQTQEASIQAQGRLRKQIEETATKQEKMNKAVAEAKRDFDAIRKADPASPLLDKEAQTLANIRDKFKETAPKAYREDAATKMLDQIRQQNAAIQVQLDLNEKLTTADQERAKFNQLIADLKGKAQLTADQRSLLARQDEIRAALDIKVASEAALEAKKKQVDEEKKHAKALEESRQLIEATNIRIEASLQGQREQYDRQLGAIGLGSQAAEQVQSQRAIYREFQNIQTEFTKSMARKGMLGSDEYAAEVTKIKSALDQALQLNESYYQSVRAAQGDWLNGARSAVQDYIDDINNVAKATAQAVDSAFKGIEDGLVNFFTTGKLNAADIGKQFAAEFVRPLVRSNFTGPLAELVQGALPTRPGAGTDPLGGFIDKLMGGSGASAAGAATASLASSSGIASRAVDLLATSALNASRSLGGGSSGLASIGSLLGHNTGALTTLANALPGDSLDNLLNLTGNFASFDVGTDFVPRDMFAKLHKGERVVRAADNVGGAPWQGSRRGGGDTFIVGDIATQSQLKKALATSQRSSAAAYMRSQRYGGAT